MGSRQTLRAIEKHFWIWRMNGTNDYICSCLQGWLMLLDNICSCLQIAVNTYSTYDLAKARWYRNIQRWVLEWMCSHLCQSISSKVVHWSLKNSGWSSSLFYPLPCVIQYIFMGGINKQHPQVFGCICFLSNYLAKLVHWSQKNSGWSGNLYKPSSIIQVIFIVV